MEAEDLHQEADETKAEELKGSSDLFLPLIILLVFAVFRSLFPAQYRALIAEGSVVETTQVILYLLAAFSSIGVSLRFLRTGRIFRSFVFLSIFPILLFICAEELDWGQHFFGFSNPDWLTLANQEKGFALHNWDVLSPAFHIACVVLGLMGAFSSSIFSSWKNRKGWRALYSILPASNLMFFFLPAALFFLYLVVLHNTGTLQLFLSEDQELFELLLAAGVFFHVKQIKEQQRGMT